MVKIFSWLTQASVGALGILTPEQMQELAAFTDGLLSLVLTLSVASLTIVVPMLLRGLQKKIESAKAQEEWKLLAHIAELAVNAAEQSILHKDNAIKYDYAVKIITDAANHHGMKFVTAEICRVLIEASVLAAKKGIKTTPSA
jgi:hypothetical protein